MIIMYEILQFLLMPLAVVVIGYQLLLGLLALLSRPHRSIAGRFNHSFLIVIPSNNNEHDISKTLYSLSGLVYPSNLYTLLVITANSADATAKIAKKMGAMVIDEKDRDKIKRGDFFAGLFEHVKLGDDPFDAMVIVDPGSLISGNFLEIMNGYLHEGSELIQSSIFKVTHSTSLIGRLKRYGFLLYNHINMMGRKVLGFGTVFIKNGTCLKGGVFTNNQRELFQENDQMELSWSLFNQGFRVDFAPEAYVWSPEISNNQKPAGGWSFTERIKKLKKFRAKFSDPDPTPLWGEYLDGLISLIMPPLPVLITATTAMVLLNWTLWKLTSVDAFYFWAWLALLGMLLLYLALGWTVDRKYISKITNMSKKPTC